ncbi:MAG TPA: cytochrome c oxidase subunit II [Pirellulales bacterium]|jgi:cytochrome c oxidase subunit 2|nr:cytochrome c oxidase subunit II [Pirellulales bacterium]
MPLFFAQVEFFPTQASTSAERVDALFFFLLGISTIISLGILATVVYFAIRYRRRPGTPIPPRITSSLKLELTWTIIPLIISLGMFAWGARVYFYVSQPPPGGDEVYVVGKQWMWKLQHQQGQREINELHLPVGQPVRLTLTSEDVIHSFFVPDFRAKIDVLPGRYVHLWFEPTKIGRYDLFCSQYCGTNHSGMIGTVVVTSRADYEHWLDAHAEGSLALEGRKIFLKYRCVSCHSADAHARAPVLENLYLQCVALRNGGFALADDNYLRNSVMKPDAQVVLGYEPIMPTFQGQISEEEMVALLAFLKSLKAGETPSRVESFPPPVAPPKK